MENTSRTPWARDCDRAPLGGLDWGDQWTDAFVPILHTYQVQNVLDLGCGTGNDVLRLVQHGYIIVRWALRQALL